MLEVIQMPIWVQVVIIVVTTLAALVALRWVVNVGVHHIVERRSAEADANGSDVPLVDIERRVKTIGLLIVKVGGAAIIVIAVLMMLEVFGIDIGPALAGLGIAGVAVGFGAQTIVRDLLAGIFIVFENQYNQGDVVRIADVDGVVEDFSLRRTVLRDLDGTVHNVPNGAITVASNMTRLWARVNLDISVTYDTDVERASAIIDRIGQEMLADEEWGPRLLEAPSVVRVAGLGDSAVSLKILGRVQAAQQWAVGGELRKRILAEFSREGIEIAVRRRVVVSSHAGGETDAAEGGAAEQAVSDE